MQAAQPTFAAGAGGQGSAPAPKIGRRTYLIDRGFQLKYTLLLAAVGAVTAGVFGGMMYLAHAEAAHALRAASLSPELKLHLAEVDATLVWLIVGAAFLMAAALALYGIVLTHRVAGPVYVITQYVRVLASGHFPKLRPLRRSDELRAFFDRFQEAVEALRGRHHEELGQLEAALSRLEPAAATPEVREAVEILRVLKEGKTAALERRERA